MLLHTRVKTPFECLVSGRQVRARVVGLVVSRFSFLPFVFFPMCPLLLRSFLLRGSRIGLVVVRGLDVHLYWCGLDIFSDLEDNPFEIDI